MAAALVNEDEEMWCAEDVDKLQLGSCFVAKFVDYFTTKVSEYKSNVKPGLNTDKESKVLSVASGVLGGGIGAGIGGIAYLINPIVGIISGAAGLSKLGAENAANYAMNKFQHKPKAKTVVSLFTQETSPATIYDPVEQQRLLIRIIAEAGIELFQKFEGPLAAIRKGDPKNYDRNMDKVTSDAVNRAIDFLSKYTFDEFSPDTIVEGVIKGVSKKGTLFKFVPYFGDRGRSTKGSDSEDWNTAEMFEGVAVVVRSKREELNGLYVRDAKKYGKYGTRLLANFEDKDFNNFIVNSGYEKSIRDEDTSTFNYMSEDLLNYLSDRVLGVFEKHDVELRFSKLNAELDEGFKSLKNLLMKLINGESSKPDRKICFEPPPKPDKNFVERKKLTDDIIAKLAQDLDQIRSRNEPIGFPLVVIYAPGGHGKTQLSRSVVLKCTELFTQPIWINTEQESHIKRDFLKHLETLDESFNCRDFDTEKYTSDFLRQKFYNALQDFSCLIVFDNVSDFELLKNYLPLNRNIRASILITSRMKWDEEKLGEVTNIQVTEFSDEESWELVEKILGKTSPENEPGVQNLVENAGGIPLTLNIMASTLKKLNWLKNGKTIEDYLKLLNLPKVLDHGDEGHSLRASVQFAIKRIAEDYEGEHGHLAVAIMNRISFLDPTYIHIECDINEFPEVKRMSKEIANSENFVVQLDPLDVVKMALKLLFDFALVKPIPYTTDTTTCDSISVHRLLQTSRQLDLQQTNEWKNIFAEFLFEVKSSSINNRFWFKDNCFKYPEFWELLTEQYQSQSCTDNQGRQWHPDKDGMLSNFCKTV